MSVAGSTTQDEATSSLHWRRVHPATPLVRMWVVLVAVGLFALREMDDLISGGYRDVLALAVSWTAWGILIGVVAIILAAFYISWRRTGYAIDDERLHFRQGVVWRTERTAPLDKIETIDIRRPLAARLIGLSQLRVEVAGGKDSYLELGFLRLTHANELRDELLRAARRRSAMTRGGQDESAANVNGSPDLAATPNVGSSAMGLVEPGSLAAQPVFGEQAAQPVFGSSPAHPTFGAQPAQPALGSLPGSSQGSLPGPLPPTASLPTTAAVTQQQIMAIPNGRLFAAALLSVEFLISVAVIMGGIVAVVVTGSFAMLAGVAALLWGFGGGAVKRFTTNFGFVVTQSEQGLRIGRGLFDHTMQSVPVERIHAIEVRQAALQRPCDWWQIRATVAGYDGESNETMLVPVATSDEVLGFLARFGLQWSDQATASRLLQGMYGDRTVPDDVFQPVPQRARLWDPFGWLRQGHWLDDDRVWLRHGRLRRSVTVIELAHCQSVAVVQGPLDRKRSLASVEFSLVSGPVQQYLDHVDELVAIELAEHFIAEDRRFRQTATAVAGKSGQVL